MRRALFGLSLALCLLAATFLFRFPPAVVSESGGEFFAESGFAVTNDSQSDFLSEFRRLGAVDALGYPVSQPFVKDGFRYQVFQRAVLQWRPEINQAYLANSMDWLSSAGKDAELANLGIPRPLGDASGGNFAAAVAERESWLTDQAIAAAYRAGGGYARYGLPASRPERSGPFIVQRFQRYAFQLWVEAVAGMPAPGTVVGILAGDLANQTGLTPAPALVKPNPALGPLALNPADTSWPGPTGADPRFGTVQVSDLKDGNERAADLGLTWSRELFLWNTLGNSPDVSKLQYTNRYYSTPLKIVGLVIFTPPYASGGPDAINPPSGLRLPWNDPGNHFGQFAYQLARTQTGKVDSWIIWNEPDICSPGMFGYSWNGTPEDYYYLLKTGYQAIKAGNPGARWSSARSASCTATAVRTARIQPSSTAGWRRPPATAPRPTIGTSTRWASISTRSRSACTKSSAFTRV